VASGGLEASERVGERGDVTHLAMQASLLMSPVSDT
jgi:hypothetical protein